MAEVKIKIKKIHPDAILPKYAHEGDAGMDLCSVGNYILKSGETTLVKTGLSFEIPQGHEVQIRSRSGLALKNSIAVLNSPGTIDSGYRGEVGIILINHGKADFEIKSGDRIAQAVLKKFESAVIQESNDLVESARGAGGFGSTGVSS